MSQPPAIPSSPPPVPADGHIPYASVQEAQQASNVRLLAIFHYVLAGITALLACVPVVHVILGVLMVRGAGPFAANGAMSTTFTMTGPGGTVIAGSSAATRPGWGSYSTGTSSTVTYSSGTLATVTTYRMNTDGSWTQVTTGGTGAGNAGPTTVPGPMTVPGPASIGANGSVMIFPTPNAMPGAFAPAPIPPQVGYFFIAIGSAFILLGWTMAALMLIAGRRLHTRRWWTFCVVIAALECLMMPLGTILGVFTLVVLNKEGVKGQFAVRAR